MISLTTIHLRCWDVVIFSCDAFSWLWCQGNKLRSVSFPFLKGLCRISINYSLTVELNLSVKSSGPELFFVEGCLIPGSLFLLVMSVSRKYI